MKISVLNCSPKNEISLTALTAKYLTKMFNEDTFDFFYTGSGEMSEEVKQSCKESDLVLITGSIFHSSVHAQMIGLLDTLAKTIDHSKPVTYLTTSYWVYELGAHHYVESWARNNGMNYIRSLSLDSNSILTPKGKEELYRWFCYVKDCMKNEEAPKFTNNLRKAVIVDGGEGNPEHSAIIKALKNRYEKAGAKVEVVALRDYNIKPCTACHLCYSDRECVYKNSDDWDKVSNAITKDTDIVIEVGTLHNGSLGERMEVYTDRNVQLGRVFMNDEIVRGYIYAEGTNAAELDARDLDDRMLALDSLCGSYQAGTVCGYKSFSSGLNEGAINKFVDDTVRIVNNELYPQQNCYGVSFNRSFAALAQSLKNMTPLDYADYARAGFYRPMPINDKCRYIKKGIPVQVARVRTFAYNADYEAFSGKVTLTERRRFKSIPVAERMRNSKPLTPEEEEALHQPMPIKFG